MDNHTTNPSDFKQNTLAPSEKHLEDWIVANLEVLVSSPAPHDHKHIPYDVKVFRQYPLPSGITDVMVIGGREPVVVMELKKGAINARAMVQILRYLRDLNSIKTMALNIMRFPLDMPSRRFDPKVRAMLVGHSVDLSDGLLVAADMLGIQIFTYSYDSENVEYEFEEHRAKPMDIEVKYSYVQGIIGQSVQQSWIRNSIDDSERDGNPSLDDIMECMELYLLETKYGVQTFYSFVKEQESQENETDG